MRPPLVVLHDPAAREQTVAALRALGWSPVDGWDMLHEAWDLAEAGVVCVGSVATPADATAALFAAARGAGVVAVLSLGGDAAHQFVEDLRHVGPVEHREALPAGPNLTEDQLGLLRLLADGMSLGEAARTLHLSLRTAERRLAEARRALGVTSTAAALLALGRGPRPPE